MRWTTTLRHLAAALSAVASPMFASWCRACRSYPTHEEMLYGVAPMFVLVYVIAPLFLVKVFMLAISDEKRRAVWQSRVSVVMNGAMLGLYDWLAILFVWHTVFGEAKLPWLRGAEAVFGPPIILGMVAIGAVFVEGGWVRHLFGYSGLSACFPLVAAFCTEVFQGERSKPLWDMERTLGILVFAAFLYAVGRSVPDDLAPWYAHRRRAAAAAIAAAARAAVPGLAVGTVAYDVVGATCRVCGEVIDARSAERAVVCDDCRTPLHRECFEWVGSRCVAYGCRSRRAHRPASAKDGLRAGEPVVCRV